MRTIELPVQTYPEAALTLLEGKEIAARIAFPRMNALVESVMVAMREATPHLLALSSEKQKRYMCLRWPFDTDETCDDGWIIRHGKGDGLSRLKDEKVYFHCRPLLRPWLEEQGLDWHWFGPLLERSEILRGFALTASQGLLESMDRVLGDQSPGLYRMLTAQRDEFVLRVLQYFGRGAEGQLGNRHWDKCLPTSQIAQSVPGLTLIHPESGEHYRVESLPDTVIVFLGRQAKLILGDIAPKARPVEHYIADCCGPDELRTSIVSFGHVIPPEEVARLPAGNVPP